MNGSQFLSGVRLNKAANYDIFEKSSSNKIHPIDDNYVDCCGLFGNSSTAQTTGREEATEAGEDCGLLDSNTATDKNNVIIKPDKPVCPPLSYKPSSVSINANTDLFGGPGGGSMNCATEEGRRLSALRRSRILQHEESPLHSKCIEAASPSSTVFSASHGVKSNKKRKYSLLSSVLGTGNGANTAPSKSSVSDNTFVGRSNAK